MGQGVWEVKKTEEKPFNFFDAMDYQKTHVMMHRIFPEIDKKSAFYKNCKRNRKTKAKICQVCPFRKGIEEQE
jgi:hypothetical protein